MKNIFILLLIILAVGFGWWYFTMRGTSNPASTTTTANTTQVSGTLIDIKDFAFSPKTLTVKAGETITVTNSDSMGHSVTADDKSFDTGVLGSGKSGSFTAPTKPGAYGFYCSLHPSTMKGVLIVE